MFFKANMCKIILHVKHLHHMWNKWKHFASQKGVLHMKSYKRVNCLYNEIYSVHLL